MMPINPDSNQPIQKKADWELDFYSRPIIEPNGKKRWELLISSTPEAAGPDPFRWEKRCPAEEVNSIWLSNALTEALSEASNQGWAPPSKLRCWRSAMRTMVKKAASQLGLEVVASRRTYALFEWLAERETDIYPKEEGYMSGPLAPGPTPILNQPTPLPEAIRGDAWTIASIPLGVMRDAQDWPIEFSGLLPIGAFEDESIAIPGLRLFSKTRSFALAGWLGSLEPVRLVIEGNQLLLEAGEDDRWLVTDMNSEAAKSTSVNLLNSKKSAGGLQFISVQATPEEQKFSGFWMLRDLNVF